MEEWTMTERSFPPPWSVQEKRGMFIVRDATDQAIGYFYFVDEKEQRPGFKHLTREEAQRIATAMTKLPELSRTGTGRQ
jgi:hypothetical protein